MDLRKVKKLIELVEESGIVELEVKSGDEAIRIAMPGAQTGAVIPAAVRSVAPPASTSAGSTALPTATAASGSHSLTAPMAGTFYRAPGPEAEPFVEVGDPVRAGEVLCIIESMKMMHEIAALEDGTVAEICIPNGDPIGTGETLFRFS